MAMGRPTKYEDRFCEEVVAYMREGFSLTAFAGKIGVSRATIDNWMREHPDFLEAATQGKALRLQAWEEIGLKVAKEGGGTGSATIVVFGLKNMGGDEWADVQRSEVSGPGGAPIQTAAKIDLSALSEEQLRALASIRLPADG